MYDKKGNIKGFAQEKEAHIKTTLPNEYGFIFIISQSIEGYFHSLVFIDAASGYRWIYGLKTKNEGLNVVKRWYANIADLRAKHKLVVLKQDNAGEYKSEEIIQFLDSKGVRSHFSTPKEQWQNGSAEATQLDHDG